MQKALIQYLEMLKFAGIEALPAQQGILETAEGLQPPRAVPSVANDTTISPAAEVDAGPPPSTVKDNSPAYACQISETSETEPDPGKIAPTESSLPETSDPLSAPTLQVLSEAVADCRKCDELVANRTQTVFGVGDPNARLCFLGEAPGADEDIQGEPFVGEAGKLLNRIIEACKMKREDVYILNTIKCRPPNNRNPHESECDQCQPFLQRQLELIQPEFICCLGGVAAKHLLNTSAGVGQLRGKIHNYQGINVVVTYHPAYLLRAPEQKGKVWADMKFLMKEMGQPLG